jgi:hypothetical protein
MPVLARASNPTTIDPDLLYSLPAFIEAVGISHGKLRDYAKQGFELPTFAVGRRKYIKGATAIEYLERLSAAQTANEGGAV